MDQVRSRLNLLVSARNAQPNRPFGPVHAACREQVGPGAREQLDRVQFSKDSPRQREHARPFGTQSVDAADNQVDILKNALFQTHWNEMPNLFEMDQAITRKKVRELLALFEEDVYEVLPEIKENLVWKVPYTSVFSLAHAPGQVGQYRPSMRTPVNNLYLINDSVKESRGMGLQAVAHTALLMTEELTGK